MRRRQFLAAGFSLASAHAVTPVSAALHGSMLTAADSATRAAGADLRRSRGGTLTSLDPHRLTSSLDAEMAAELFVGLTTTDARGRLVPGCAARWTASADGLRWQFTLRPDCRWSDGRELLAADFVYALRRFLAPGTGATLAFRLDAVRNARAIRVGKLAPEMAGVAAPDERTVAFTLEHPETDLPGLLAVVYPVPRHVIAAHGRDWAKPAFIATNGAFGVRAWAQNGNVTLDRNPHFWEAARVAPAMVTWVLGVDDSTRVRMFRSGELDLATITDGTSLALAKRDHESALRSVPAWSAGWIGINTRRGKLAEPAVRRALAMSIDREALAQKVRQLDERPWTSIMPAAVTGYGMPLLPEYAAWPAAERLQVARRLLATHGIGINNRMPLRAVFSANPVTQRTFLAIAAMWRPLGVDVELVGLETRAYSIRLRSGDYDLQDYVPFATIQTPATFIGRFASDSFLNFMYYRNTDVDGWIAAGDRAADAAQRITAYRRVERQLLVDCPVIPLYSGVTHRLVGNRIVGWHDHTALATPSRFLIAGDRARRGARAAS